jgi:glycosyltransferase involved in cell wall biosynthesis
VVTAAELKELLGSARAVSVPSLYRYPVASPTVLEAIASHTPVVVSPSISTLIAKHGENCIVESTAEGMAQRFDELFDDDTLWDKLSAGCARSKVRFDSLTVAKDYIQLAEELRTR